MFCAQELSMNSAGGSFNETVRWMICISAFPVLRFASRFHVLERGSQSFAEGKRRRDFTNVNPNRG